MNREDVADGVAGDVAGDVAGAVDSRMNRFGRQGGHVINATSSREEQDE